MNVLRRHLNSSTRVTRGGVTALDRNAVVPRVDERVAKDHVSRGVWIETVCVRREPRVVDLDVLRPMVNSRDSLQEFTQQQGILK